VLTSASYDWQASLGDDGEDGLAAMKYVYLLQSIDFPNETYVGLTDDLRARMSAHNKGHSRHTDKYKPWRLVTYIAFSDHQKAVDLSAT
jgi:putative endonuclease